MVVKYLSLVFTLLFVVASIEAWSMGRSIQKSTLRNSIQTDKYCSHLFAAIIKNPSDIFLSQWDIVKLGMKGGSWPIEQATELGFKGTVKAVGLTLVGIIVKPLIVVIDGIKNLLSAVSAVLNRILHFFLKRSIGQSIDNNSIVKAKLTDDQKLGRPQAQRRRYRTPYSPNEDIILNHDEESNSKILDTSSPTSNTIKTESSTSVNSIQPLGNLEVVEALQPENASTSAKNIVTVDKNIASDSSNRLKIPITLVSNTPTTVASVPVVDAPSSAISKDLTSRRKENNFVVKVPGKITVVSTETLADVPVSTVSSKLPEEVLSVDTAKPEVTKSLNVVSSPGILQPVLPLKINDDVFKVAAPTVPSQSTLTMDEAKGSPISYLKKTWKLFQLQYTGGKTPQPVVVATNIVDITSDGGLLSAVVDGALSTWKISSSSSSSSSSQFEISVPAASLAVAMERNEPSALLVGNLIGNRIIGTIFAIDASGTKQKVGLFEMQEEINAF